MKYIANKSCNWSWL